MSTAETDSILLQLENDYEAAATKLRDAYHAQRALPARLYMEAAKQAFDKVFFDEAKEFMDFAVTLDHSDPEILNYAAWVEIQFSVTRSSELLHKYFDVTTPITPFGKPDEIVYAHAPHNSTPRIALLLPSTRLNNADEGTAPLFRSLKRATSNPLHVEIIIKIDAADDVQYYRQMASYLPPAMRCTIIRGHSYQGLRSIHNLFEDCYHHVQSGCQLVIPLTDRMVFNKRRWDHQVFKWHAKGKSLLQLTHNYRLQAPTFQEAAWLLPLSRPQGATYAISVPLLKQCKEMLGHIADMTHFGGDYNVSMFFAMLEYLLRSEACIDSMQCLPGTVCRRTETTRSIISAQDRQLLMMQTYYRFLDGSALKILQDKLRALKASGKISYA